MNKLFKNIKGFNKSLNKKYGKTTIKNILLVVGFLIVLILGVYLGRSLNKNKEGFEDGDTGGFFDSDAIMSVTDMDLSELNNKIDANTTAIEQYATDVLPIVLPDIQVIKDIKNDIANYATEVLPETEVIKNIQTDIKTNSTNLLKKMSGTAGLIIPYFPKVNSSDGTKIDRSECTDLLMEGFIPCDIKVFNFGDNSKSIALQDKANRTIGIIFKYNNFIYLTTHTDINTTEYSSSKVTADEIIARIPILNRKFIVGSGKAGRNQSGDYNIGSTGGSEKHRLTINEMPSHRHYTGIIGTYYHERSIGNQYRMGTHDGVGNRKTRNWNSSYEGGNGSHENRPPYMAMTYIYYLGDGYKYYNDITILEKLSEDDTEKAEKAKYIQSLVEKALA
jgi:hypothetical protein